MFNLQWQVADLVAQAINDGQTRISDLEGHADICRGEVEGINAQSIYDNIYTPKLIKEICVVTTQAVELVVAFQAGDHIGRVITDEHIIKDAAG